MKAGSLHRQDVYATFYNLFRIAISKHFFLLKLSAIAMIAGNYISLFFFYQTFKPTQIFYRIKMTNSAAWAARFKFILPTLLIMLVI